MTDVSGKWILITADDGSIKTVSISQIIPVYITIKLKKLTL
jgi:hypothetical protein